MGEAYLTLKVFLEGILVELRNSEKHSDAVFKSFKYEGVSTLHLGSS
jgi:hypothetical protein